MLKISNDIPAGNVKVLAISGHDVLLDVELRDTSIDWFYWEFKAEFSEPGRYTFRFASPNKIGTQGPAVSYDEGMTWQWLGAESEQNAQSFFFDADGRTSPVYFCMGLQYLQRHFDRFLQAFKTNPFLSVETLCTSPQGRRVEHVIIQEGTPKYRILLTARHHANEMMANHALEGIFRTVLDDTEFARQFRKQIAVHAVPFVDKDGVEAGDQGKSRIPRDHNRDYSGKSLYPETAAIQKLIDDIRPIFVLDMHCPWIRGGCNEHLYFPGSENLRMSQALDVFSRLLEKESTREAPFCPVNNIPFGTSWNTGANYTQGMGLKMYAESMAFIRCAQTIEIPFANFGDVKADQSNAHILGKNLARAILRYLTDEA